MTLRKTKTANAAMSTYTVMIERPYFRLLDTNAAPQGSFGKNGAVKNRP
jgi:hypothetical protein